MKTLPAILILAYGVSPLFAEEKPTAQANPFARCTSRTCPRPRTAAKRAWSNVAMKMMGLSHEKTTHHFRLYPDGGSIEAEANDSEDAASRDQIRSHLAHIATMFAAGNFRAPCLFMRRTRHGQNP